jgi:acyl carrier protein
MSIEDQVKAILVRMLDIDDALIVPAATLREDLGATSIDFVEFMTALENDFDVNIPDEDVSSLTTVQSAVDYIRARKP